MSDETIRALERELQRHGEDVMILRATASTLPLAGQGVRCLVCRSADVELRVLDMPNGWICLCRACIERIVERTVDPQYVARVTADPGGGALYVRIEKR